MIDTLITQIDAELASIEQEQARLTNARSILMQPNHGGIVVGLSKGKGGRKPKLTPEQKALALIAEHPGMSSRELGLAPLMVAKLSRSKLIQRSGNGWAVK